MTAEPTPDPPPAEEAKEVAASADETEDAEEDAEDAIPADELRRLANAHFAQQSYDVALPLYSAAVDAARIEDDEWARAERVSGYEAAVAAVESDAGGGAAAAADAENGGGGGGGGVGAANGDHVAGGNDEDDDDVDSAYYREPAAVLHLCNRSACLFKMERYEEARNDAREAADLCRGRNSKAWFRLARAQMSMGQYGSAVRALESGLRNSDREERELDREERELEEGEAPLCMDDDDGTEKKRAGLEQRRKNLNLQRRELTKLLATSKKRRAQTGRDAPDPSTLEPVEIKSIKLEPRKPSIREFETLKEIGVGNFSRTVVCRHRTTGEEFALKIIEKKKAEQLAKRQHPNVYNEIQMERRILAERLPAEGGHPRIVRLYHAIQDYGNLYMLTELHALCGDLWSRLRDRGKMVGCHPSTARLYLSELLDAVEFLHHHGVVHRDLKPENVVLSDRGHVVLLDLGTAKDMVYTDLNGPEFVGTPDYMAPEMVKGTSGDGEVERARAEGKIGADHTADLWAFGCIVYQLCTGVLPLAAPSPYLAFLRIQRGNLYRPWGVADDDAWDLIRSLLRINPRERLGADGFDFTDAAEESPSKEAKEGAGETSEAGSRETVAGRKYGVGYDVIRQHPYFQKGTKASTPGPVDIYNEPVPVPSLRDLCIRAVAEQVRLDSLDLDSDAKHPPGDGSSHDVLRLNPVDRKCVMHYLDRINVLGKPRAFRRFFKTKAEARLGRVRPESVDCVGLTQLGDGMGQFPTKECGENADPRMKELAELGDPIQFVHITNPLFQKEVNVTCDEDARKKYVEQLKDSIRKTNRTRPKLAVAVGYFDKQCRRLLAKVNETIPTVLCDGSAFFSFWVCGAQGLFIRSRDFIVDAGDDAGEEQNAQDIGVRQSAWLGEQLEQSRTAGHHLFAFVDCDPRELPSKLVRKLARGKTLCMYGSCDPENRSETSYESEYRYEGHEGEEDGDDKKSSDVVKSVPANADGDEESVESQDEKAHTMKIAATSESSLCCITLEEYGEWKSDVI